MTRVAAAVVVAAAAAAAAVLLNLVLLGRASGDTERIGRLQPLASIPTTTAPSGTIRPLPSTTSEKEHARHDGRESDD